MGERAVICASYLAQIGVLRIHPPYASADGPITGTGGTTHECIAVQWQERWSRDQAQKFAICAEVTAYRTGQSMTIPIEAWLGWPLAQAVPNAPHKTTI